jgi:HK97 family phage portal protein
MNEPSIWKRLAAALGFGGAPETKRSPYNWPAYHENKPIWHLTDYRTYVEEGFNLNSLIYSAITYKARASISSPLRAYEGDREHPERCQPDHPLSKLLDRPNQYQSGAEMMQLLTVYLNISGNAYLHFDRAKRGEMPTSIRPLRPDRVFIIPQRGGLQGYIYVPEGKTPTAEANRDDIVPILPEDIMHVKLPNPGDPLEGLGYGLSPLSAAAYSADVDNDVTRFLKLFFQKGTMGNTALSFDVPMEESEVSRARARWMEVYGGYQNWSDIVILDQGGKVQRLGMTFDEMGFGDLDERNESRILGPLGVPVILLGTRIGLKRGSYNNYETARRAFWQDTFVPELAMYESEFVYYLTAPDGAFPRFDLSDVPALQQDKPRLVEAAYRLWQMGIPANIALPAMGLEMDAVKGGDVGWVSNSVQPVERALKPPAPPPPQLVAAPAAKPVVDEKPPPNGQGNEGAANAEEDGTDDERKDFDIKAWTPEYKESLWKAVDAIATSWEDRYAEAAEQCLETDKREILALLNEAKEKSLELKMSIDWVKYWIDVAAYIREHANGNWRKVFTPLLQGTITDQARHWASVLGTAFDVENLFASKWFEEYTLTFAQKILETHEEQLSSLLQQAQRQGWSIDTMKNRMGDVFQQWAKGDLSPETFQWLEARLPAYRREMIARTESMRASNAGSVQLYKEYGAHEVEWLATMDNRVRDSHAAANGQRRMVGEPFSVNGYSMLQPGDSSMGAPASEIVNCRCTVIVGMD